MVIKRVNKVKVVARYLKVRERINLLMVFKLL